MNDHTFWVIICTAIYIVPVVCGFIFVGAIMFGLCGLVDKVMKL
jgi:hypothetical protein